MRKKKGTNRSSATLIIDIQKELIDEAKQKSPDSNTETEPWGDWFTSPIFSSRSAIATITRARENSLLPASTQDDIFIAPPRVTLDISPFPYRNLRKNLSTNTPSTTPQHYNEAASYRPPSRWSEYISSYYLRNPHSDLSKSTPTTKPQLYTDIFLNSVKNNPQGIAVSLNGQTLSYTELNHASINLALQLIQKKGSLEGRRIALVMPKCLEYDVVYHAVLKAGGALVFIRAPEFDEKDRTWRFGDFAKILSGDGNDWKVDLIISHSRYESVMNAHTSLKEITLYADLENIFNFAEPSKKLPPMTISLEKEMYTVFTSGTTGKPKGAINSHAGLPNLIDSHIQILKLNKDSVIAQDRPLYIDASWMERIMAAAVGARLEVVPEGLGDWQEYIDFLNTHQVTHAIVVPSILKQIYQQYKSSNQHPFTTLKYILTTGESMTAEVYDFFYDLGLTLVNGFGSSECAVGQLLWTYEKGCDISIGKPMLGVETFIVATHENGEVIVTDGAVALKDEGQLMLMGPCVGLGYTNHLEPNQSRFRYFNKKNLQIADKQMPDFEPCYLTGDKVSQRKVKGQNLYYLEGRYGTQLKIHGKLLMPEEIQVNLEKLEYIEKAQIDVLRNAAGESTHVLIAGIRFKPGQSVPFTKIQEDARVRLQLDADKIPTLWQAFAPLENQVDAQWKIAPLFKGPIQENTAAAQDFKVAHHDSHHAQQQMSSQDISLTAQVTALFKATLPQSELLPHIAFEYLGGRSLMAMSLANKLREKFNMTFVAGKLLQQSVQDVVQHIDEDQQEVEVRQLNKKYCDHHPETQNNPEVIFIHALLGNANNDYDRFAEFFENNAIYGISAKSFTQTGDIDVYAQHYKIAIQKKLNEIHKTNAVNRKRLILVGWSSGGLIAHRIQELLRKEGYDIGLFMLDTTSGHHLRKMSTNEHRHYSTILAKLTGKFIAGSLFAPDDLRHQRYLKKLDRITLADTPNKEQHIEHAFRQLLNINEDFKTTETFAHHKANVQMIRNAWSIALGVLRYESNACHDVARKPKDETGPEMGALFCRLFYASKNKVKELGQQVQPNLGWDLDSSRQVISLDGTHLSIMKKIDDVQSSQAVPTEFNQLVQALTENCENLEKHFRLDFLKDKIVKYYKRNATIKLPVFDLPQHVNDSYVHLAIVDNQAQNELVRNTLQQNDTVLAPGRLGTLNNQNLTTLGRGQTYEDINKVKDPIDIAKLFDTNNRAVVLGRAGIGKSTFCKYITYQWSDKKYWPKFNMIYWLPLRYLVNYPFGNRQNDSLEQLAHFIVYVMPKLKMSKDSAAPGLNITSDAVLEQLENEGDTTLFVLDGYDEIKGFIEKGDGDDQKSAKVLLDFILNDCKNYLITSRPHAVVAETFVNKVDNRAHYELMGFTNDDIPKYIEKTFALLNRDREEKLKASDAIAKIRNNVCVWGPSHVPINLALICSVWNNKLFEKLDTINMTQLYAAIIERIYKINIDKLWRHGKSENTVKLGIDLARKNDEPFERKFQTCRPIIDFLEKLAFDGMRNNQLIFPHSQIREILNQSKIDQLFELAKRMGLSTPSIDDPDPIASIMHLICSIGLLNALPDGKDGDAYYFIHLTFQEYFAACHLKKSFSVDNVKQIFDNFNIRPGVTIQANTEIVFDTRYEVVIGFLAGKIYEENRLSPTLELFFKELTSQVKTNLVNHPLLLMLLCRCLEEVSLDNVILQADIIKAIRSLLERILFYTKDTQYAYLEEYRKMCIDMLKSSPKLTQQLDLDKRLAELKNTTDAPLWAMVVYLELYATDPMQELIKIIINKNKRETVRQEAIESLAGLHENDATKTDYIVALLIQYFSISELRETAWKAIVMLNKQNSPVVVSFLEDQLEKKIESDEEHALACINKLVENNHITLPILICYFRKIYFIRKDKEFTQIIDLIKKQHQQKFVSLCKEIFLDPQNKHSDFVKFNALNHCTPYENIDEETIIFLLENYDSGADSRVRDLLENYEKNNLPFLEDMVARILKQEKIKSEWLLCTCTKICTNNKLFTNPILVSLGRLLDSTYFNETSAEIIKDKGLHKHPLISEKYSQYLNEKKPPPPPSPIPSPVRYVSAGPQRAQISTDFLYLGESFWKTKESHRKYFSHGTVIRQCYENLKVNKKDTSQIAVDILLENGKTGAEIVNVLISNASHQDNDASCQSATQWVFTLGNEGKSRHILHDALIKNLLNPMDRIVSFSLKSLLSLSKELSDADIQAIDECFYNRGDALEDSGQLTQNYQKILLASGKLADKSRHQLLLLQLTSLIPRLRLSAAEALLSTQSDPQLLANIKAVLFELIHSCPDASIRTDALNILKKQRSSANPDWILALTKNLSDPNPGIARSALHGLALFLPLNIANFAHGLSDAPLWPYERLIHMPTLPDELMAYLRAQPYETDPDSIGILSVLYSHKQLNETIILKQFEFFMRDKNEVYVLQILQIYKQALFPHLNLWSHKFVSLLIKWLQSTNTTIQQDVETVFKKQQHLLTIEPNLPLLLQMLTSSDTLTRKLGVFLLTALQDISHFSSSQLDILAKAIKCDFFDISLPIIKWLKNLESLHHIVEPSLHICLSKRSSDIREAARQVLQHHDKLETAECLSTLLGMFTQGDPLLRSWSMSILNSLKSIPEFNASHLSLLNSILSGPYLESAHALLVWLMRYPHPPLKLHATLCACLSSTNQKIRESAFNALKHHQLLTTAESLYAVLGAMQSRNLSIRNFGLFIFYSLNSFSILTHATLDKFNAILANDTYHQISSAVAKWLMQFTAAPLPQSTETALLNCLSSNHEDVRLAALETLQAYERLNKPNALIVLIKMLTSSVSSIRTFSLSTLNSLDVAQDFFEQKEFSFTGNQQSLLLQNALSKRSPDIHIQLINWLMKFKILPNNVMTLLMDDLIDSNAQVSFAALSVLQNHKHQVVLIKLNSLLNLLRSQHKYKRIAAAKLIESLSPVGYLNSISIGLMHQILYGPYQDAKESILAWLEQFSSAPTSILLQPSDFEKILLYLESNWNSRKNCYGYWRLWQFTMVVFLSMPTCEQHRHRMLKITQEILSEAPNIYRTFDGLLSKNESQPSAAPLGIDLKDSRLAHGLTILFNNISSWVNYIKDNTLHLYRVHQQIQTWMAEHTFLAPRIKLDLTIYQGVLNTLSENFRNNSNDARQNMLAYATQVQMVLKNIASTVANNLGAAPYSFFITTTGGLAYGALLPNDPISYSLEYVQNDHDAFKRLQAEDYFASFVHEFNQFIIQMPETWPGLIVEAISHSHELQTTQYQRYIYTSKIPDETYLKYTPKNSTLHAQELRRTDNLRSIQEDFLYPLYDLIIQQNARFGYWYDNGSFHDLIALLIEHPLFSASYTRLLVHAHQFLCGLCIHLSKGLILHSADIAQLQAIELIILNPYYESNQASKNADPYFNMLLMNDKIKKREALSKMHHLPEKNEILHDYICQLLDKLMNQPIGPWVPIKKANTTPAPLNMQSEGFLVWLLDYFHYDFNAIPWYDVLTYAQEYFAGKDTEQWEKIIDTLLTWPKKVRPFERFHVKEFLEQCEILDADTIGKINVSNKEKIFYDDLIEIEKDIEAGKYTIPLTRQERFGTKYIQHRHHEQFDTKKSEVVVKHKPSVQKNAQMKSYAPKDTVLMQHAHHNKSLSSSKGLYFSKDNQSRTVAKPHHVKKQQEPQKIEEFFFQRKRETDPLKKYWIFSQTVTKDSIPDSNWDHFSYIKSMQERQAMLNKHQIIQEKQLNQHRTSSLETYLQRIILKNSYSKFK